MEKPLSLPKPLYSLSAFSECQLLFGTIWSGITARLSASLKEGKALEGIHEWVKSFPVKELLKRNALAAYEDNIGLARALLQFFGVSSPAAWKQIWTSPQAAYRRSSAFQVSREATAAWLRLGEIEAKKIDVPEFNKGVFKQAFGSSAWRNGIAHL